MPFTLLIVWLLTLFTAPLQQESGPVIEAQAGFDRLYEESSAVPVVVTARNDGPAIDGTILVSAVASDTGVSLVYSAPISLPTGSDKRVPLVVYLPAFSSGLSVRLVSGDEVVAQTRTERLNNVQRDEMFYGVITPDPGRLAFLETVTGGRSGADVAFLTLADLPEVSAAWAALDVLVIDDTDTSRLTPGQMSAMRAWLDGGGQLVVTGGTGGPQTAAGLADLLPVSVSAVESVSDLSALGAFAGEPIDPGAYPVTISSLTSGESLIHQDGLPLLARRDTGRGAVTFLALDPKAAPLSGWMGEDQLWAEIAANAPLLPPWAGGAREGYAATQSVSYIPGLRLPSIWQLILFLLLYLLIIGPVNYLVLRRINRRELAWITIPALVLLFSAVTFFTGFRTRGNTTTLNTMTVAFGSVEGEQVQSQTIMGLYSPRRATYDVTLPYDSAAYPFTQGFGTLVSGSNLNRIDRAADLTLRGVRTDTSEVATFIVESHQPRPAISATAAQSAGNENEIEVTVRNNTGEPLEHAVLVYGQSQRSLGTLAPGEERSMGLRIPTVPITSTMMFPPSTSYYLNALVSDPQHILGTPNYYNDPVAYPRWQLIQSYYQDSIDPAAIPDPTEVVTLGGWLPGSAQEVAVTGETNRLGQTLVLLEIPVR